MRYLNHIKKALGTSCILLVTQPLNLVASSHLAIKAENQAWYIDEMTKQYTLSFGVEKREEKKGKKKKERAI